ncbi:MAG: hypothetical protein Q8N51_01120 [Gammaproteobacteria bacterium]|nr:hypothetical protein [Gammaproteobacteria bacterium]
MTNSIIAMKLLIVVFLITGCATQAPIMREQIIVEPPIVKKYLFYEDFSNVLEGQIPSAWIDCATMAVKPSKKLRGKNVFSNFKPGKSNIIIPNIPFKPNFVSSFTIFVHDEVRKEPVTITIGDITVQLGTCWWIKSKFNSSPFNMPNPSWAESERSGGGKIINIAIIKNGLVCKLEINGTQVSLIRLEKEFLPKMINITADVNTIAIYQIDVIELP